MLIASLILFDAAKSYDFIYDYEVPENVDVKPGVRVSVPFGRSNIKRVGFVLSLRKGQMEGLKQIEAAVDVEPLLNFEGLNLVYYLHETTFCLWYEAVKCQIPPGMGMKVLSNYEAAAFTGDVPLQGEEKRIYDILTSRKRPADEKTLFSLLGIDRESKELKSLIKSGCVLKTQRVRRNILDKKTVMARLLPCEEQIKLTPRQKEVQKLLLDVGAASLKEISYFLGVSAAVIKAMAKKGVIELYEELLPLDAESSSDAAEAEISLSSEQREVYNGLCQKLGSFSVNLLYGVTGSGKTEVFLRLIQTVESLGKTSLVLIPEISLTPQTARKFKSHFKSKVAVLNSTLSMTERLEQYRLIKEGKATIVVGTRLSVFSPLENIGLIVMDEEQESTYHSEQSPRFHARNVAKMRAKTHSCPLLLCSATPSVESFYKAVTGKYGLFELKNRFSKRSLPDVYMLDMLKEPFEGDSVIFSQRLCLEIDYNLNRSEQVLLLLNRRGFLTKLSCISCRQVIKCPSCSVAMTYHSANNRLMCHMCGYQCSVPKSCPSCGARMLKYQGEGTQKAEDELKRLFPKARILRMDADTTLSKNSHQRAFEDFRDGKYDIMIGTQMISKGLDFPLVTLVGIINADQALFTDDFRGFEKAFSLITQTIGRAGRGDIKGRAFIETLSPDLELFRFCRGEDYEGFYKEEIEYRRSCLYPPFCDMVKAEIRSHSQEEACEDAAAFGKILTELASKNYSDLPLRILGPSQANPFKRSNIYYMQFLIKCRVGRRLLKLLSDASEQYQRSKRRSFVAIDSFYI